jgi:hypothetical protein
MGDFSNSDMMASHSMNQDKSHMSKNTIKLTFNKYTKEPIKVEPVSKVSDMMVDLNKIRKRLYNDTDSEAISMLDIKKSPTIKRSYHDSDSEAVDALLIERSPLIEMVQHENTHKP